MIPPRRRIPLWVNVLYTAFVAVLIPTYWTAYGPQNFLYFCDVAAIVTGVGLWLASPLLLSIEAVAILVPQTVWIADFLTRLLGGRLFGLTDYMFDPGRRPFVRGLSLFHGWLPLLILWAIGRLGYDRRAFRYQTVIGVGLLLVCFLAFAPPGAINAGRKPVNLNYVYGLDEKRPQSWMPHWAWLLVVLVGVPTLMFLPTHLILRKTFREPR